MFTSSSTNPRSHLQKILEPTGQIKFELPRQLVAEFMGVLLFQIFGGAAPPKDTTAPAANGFALVAIVYTFANISGAHLNPAVTFALMCTGHMKWWKGLLYIIVQVGSNALMQQASHDTHGRYTVPQQYCA